MTEHLLRARLLNAEGELIAEGPCWLDENAGHATLEPERTAGVIQKVRGSLALELDSGRSLAVSDRPMIIHFRQGPDSGRRVYKLRLLHSGVSDNQAQDANATGVAGEGSPASGNGALPPRAGETPAAR